MEKKQQWHPPTDEEARREADWRFSEEEQKGNWKHWKGEGYPPWWVAGSEWVWAVVEAYGHRLAVEEKCFDDTFRRRMSDQIASQARIFWDKKLCTCEHYRRDPLPDAREAFVKFTLRELTERLAAFDQEVLKCTVDGPEEQGRPASTASPIRRHERVTQFLERVSSEAGRRVRRRDFWTVAGYNDPTEFERWQREDEKRTASASRNFERVLAMSPETFFATLDKMRPASK
jgi:hypothetical protein